VKRLSLVGILRCDDCHGRFSSSDSGTIRRFAIRRVSSSYFAETPQMEPSGSQPAISRSA